jgi:CcmD family protein
MAIFCMLLFLCTTSFAQDNSIEMADTLRENGKIYVVVTILSVIFAGIAIYLLRLDRRISKMEKERK